MYIFDAFITIGESHAAEKHYAKAEDLLAGALAKIKSRAPNSPLIEKIAFGDNLNDFPSFRKLYNFLKGKKIEEDLAKVRAEK